MKIGGSTVPPLDSVEALYASARRGVLLGLAVNLALGVIKLIGGVVGHSFALVSDAVNSFGDSLTSVVVLYGLEVAQRPPDSEHPYGHTRAEAVASVCVALLIAFSALLVGWQAIARITLVHEMPSAWTLWIAGANVVLKEALYRINLRIGRQTGSQAVVTNAWDHRSDALCSLAVLIGIALVRWGGEGWLWADEGAALVVVAAILWAAYQLFRTSASQLMDLQADPELVQEIRRVAGEVPGVRGVETLWVRRSGLEYFADIHIEVDPAISVAEGHRISHVVKARLVDRFTALRDVLVHLEPHPHTHDDSRCAENR
jgi:cation diffusion facilitator family transporter